MPTGLTMPSPSASKNNPKADGPASSAEKGEKYTSTNEKRDPKQDLIAELRCQLEVNEAEFSALRGLADKQAERRSYLFTTAIILLVSECLVLGLLLMYGFSNDLSRYLLLPLTILLAFFIAMAAQGAWISRSLSRALQLAIAKQLKAIDGAKAIFRD